MIKEMTPAQEAKLPQYFKKWEIKGYRTEKIDKEKATNAVHFLYKKIMKRAKPEIIIFLDSPMACQLAMNLIKNTKFESPNLEDELDSQLRSQLYSHLYSHLYSQLDSQLRSHLGSHLYSQLRSQLYSRLGSQLYSQLRSHLYSHLYSRLRSRLRSHLYSRLYSQFDSQLYSQFDSQLDSQFDSQLDSQQLEYFYSTTSNWYGWMGYYCFYDFVLNVLMPEKRSDFKLFTEFCTHYPEIHYGYFFEKIAFISDFPEKIILDNRFRLHSLTEPCLSYRDSYQFKSLDGVRIPDNIFDLINDKTKAKDILKIKNAEHRLVAIKYFGIDNLLEELGAKVKDKKGDEYELLTVNLEGSEERLLKMKNPSEPKTHYEFVPPNIQTVNQAMAWRIGWDSYKEPIMKA